MRKEGGRADMTEGAEGSPTLVHCALSALKSRLQLELPDPPLVRAIERMHPAQLCNRETQQVHAKPRSGAEDRVPDSGAEHRRLMRRIPGQAAVAEDGEFKGERTVVARSYSQRPKEREPQLGVGHNHAAAEQLVEHRTAVGVIGSGLAFSGVERTVAVTTNQSGVTQKERL